MKNIHVLPTDKPSRLVKGKINDNFLLADLPMSNKYYYRFNIYITSDEEVKPNTYCLINGVLCKTELLEGRIVSRQLVGGATMDICKSEYLEIILTTDLDLIDDGIEQLSEDKLLKIVEFLNSGKNIEYFDEL